MGWARKLGNSPWPTGEGRVPQALQRIGMSGGASAHANETGRGDLGRRRDFLLFRRGCCVTQSPSFFFPVLLLHCRFRVLL